MYVHYFVSLFLAVSTGAVNCLERLVSEMTCYVSSGTLNPKHRSQSIKRDVKLFSITPHRQTLNVFDHLAVWVRLPQYLYSEFAVLLSYQQMLKPNNRRRISYIS